MLQMSLCYYASEWLQVIGIEAYCSHCLWNGLFKMCGKTNKLSVHCSYALVLVYYCAGLSTHMRLNVM